MIVADPLMPGASTHSATHDTCGVVHVHLTPCTRPKNMRHRDLSMKMHSNCYYVEMHLFVRLDEAAHSQQ